MLDEYLIRRNSLKCGVSPSAMSARQGHAHSSTHWLRIRPVPNRDQFI